MNKTLIISDKNTKSLRIKKQIVKLFKNKKIKKSNVVVVIGGDGFMLQTLKKNKKKNKMFYGINSGTYGFLMNSYSKSSLVKKIDNSNMISIYPLEMNVLSKNRTVKCIAVNEVSILRQSRQAANLSIKINSKYTMKKLVSDGVLISTPAGSTAYNLSVYGPILSLNSKKISVAPISAFRPRRWPGKIISDKSKIVITNLNSSKRPVSAVADNIEIRNAKKIKIKINKDIKFNLLYDKTKSLQKKIMFEKIKSKIY